jgi:hypothetical protein
LNSTTLFLHCLLNAQEQSLKDWLRSWVQILALGPFLSTRKL